MADTVTEIFYEEVDQVDDSDPGHPITTRVIVPRVVERPMTADEIAQREADALEVAARAAAAEQADADRQAAIDHARGLGFTDAMIAAMWPGLGLVT